MLLSLPRKEHRGVAVKDRQMLRILDISMPPELMFKSKQEVPLAVMSGVLEALLLPVPPERQDPSKKVFKRTCVGVRTLQSLCYGVGANSVLLSGFMCSGRKNMVRWAVT